MPMRVIRSVAVWGDKTGHEATGHEGIQVLSLSLSSDYTLVRGSDLPKDCLKTPDSSEFHAESVQAGIGCYNSLQKGFGTLE